ncbi:tetratricopeptide repeat-containing sulfotransferase family protein [Prochlorococcus marinus]|uniref:Flp pilus assembly protein TadD n=1 Tax=Prochlorococcus marinus (strain MIT 9211) TaxID=93059 RepID=A9BC10_PROM4|nr:sulfotransferase [Prochlorococcus marinus]ABX09372.1 Flp pilus assembly protein TadD [Prochlorococcus marinus str. MIT 9211]
MNGFGEKKISNKKKFHNQLSEVQINQLMTGAIRHLSSGNFVDAEACYMKLINAGFKDPRVYSNIGAIYKQRNNLDKACFYLKKAVTLFPEYADAYSNLALILKEKGELKEAELYARKAISLKPNLCDAYLILGGILQDQGDLDQAILCTRKAIILDPNLASSHLNLGVLLKEKGNLKEAEDATRKAISLQSNLANAHLNLGVLLKEKGNLKEAEDATRKAISLQSNLANAHLNLGILLKDLGKLKEAEKTLIKAIQIDGLLAPAYYSLSTLTDYSNERELEDKLFKINLDNLDNLSFKIDLCFARSNILHKKNLFLESSEYLKEANKIKLQLYPSNANKQIKKSIEILDKYKDYQEDIPVTSPVSNCIFIVGMPRSGSTLLESILSMKEKVVDLGETVIFEQAFSEWNMQDKQSKGKSLFEIYYEKRSSFAEKECITTDKNLYNYMYSGFIASQFPAAKIIHCYRNPLDNILSMYRANFAKGNYYSSSILDCSKVLSNHIYLMNYYKKLYPEKIYSLDYDQLVISPKDQIRSLINWLGWEWEELYLSPDKSNRAVSTASNVQVRYPINNKSLYGWKKYTELLKPAIDYLDQKII